MRLPGNSAASQSDPTAALPTRGKGMPISGSPWASSEQSTTAWRGVRRPWAAQAAAKATLSLRASMAPTSGKGTA